MARGTKDKLKGTPVRIPPNGQIFNAQRNHIAVFNYFTTVDTTYRNAANSADSFTLTNARNGYSLGLLKRGGALNEYLFQTEKTTHKFYQGPYPPAGWYDVGNDLNIFSGRGMQYVGRNIITSYYGEFWKASQTNKFNHYWDNGLAIGQFGTTRPEIGFGNAGVPEMAGNALTPMLVKDGSGDLYLYHGDESDHGGLHRWKITGLNTVAEQVITVPFPAAYIPPVLPYTNLMEGLPFNATLINNTAGWTRVPAVNYEDSVNL